MKGTNDKLQKHKNAPAVNDRGSLVLLGTPSVGFLHESCTNSLSENVWEGKIATIKTVIMLKISFFISNIYSFIIFI